MLSVTVSDIMQEFQPKGVLSEAFGGEHIVINGLGSTDHYKATDLIFMDKDGLVEKLKQNKPAAIVTTAKLKPLLESISNVAVMVAPNLPMAHALLKQRFAGRDFAKSGWSGIHPSAIIHETAKIGDGTIVEPRAVVGARTHIGKNCRIMAGVVIENDVIIGDGCVIHPNSVISYECKLGNDVIVNAGSVIGSEGYGFAQDAKRKSHAIPQTGIVVIEDRVRVGANNCIDRAAYFETRIGAGTKLDNLCHIAHNVTVGEDCLLTAFFCVAGSSDIGNRVIASGQTGISDHVKICDDVVLLHRAGVTKDIETPGAYAALPLQPLKQYMKNAILAQKLTELRDRVKALEEPTKSV